MSLVFAAITPHPPILIPAIGKDNIKQIEKTKSAMEKLEEELYSAKPDIVMIISPHGEMSADSFTVNLSNDYEVNFESFGDFTTKLQFKGETVLMTMGKEKIAAKSPLNIISESALDHGAGVPLFYLMRHLPQVPIIPLSFSMLDNQAHVEFGKGLKELILNTDKRVAVIASGDLSHCLTKNAPVPYNPAGNDFDQTLIELVKKCDTQGITNIDHKLVSDAAECGLRSILILSGIISDMKCQPEVLSYEGPFGVGYLVAEVKFD
ncbi:MAG: AmmeMemoRadiSam system protein B [Patescibacteria group bacterium]|jgi:aromatic ring-opening dioxygenase LigB subunit